MSPSDREGPLVISIGEPQIEPSPEEPLEFRISSPMVHIPIVHNLSPSVLAGFCRKAALVAGRDIGQAVELFAKDGSYFSRYLLPHCTKLTGIDIEPAFRRAFEGIGRNAEFRCGDSHQLLDDSRWQPDGGFSLVSIDNPLGVFGSSSQYCEHFDILEKALGSASGEGAMIFNVVATPYDYDAASNSLWRERRQRYYGVKADHLTVKFMSEFYTGFFRERAVEILDLEFCCREVRDGVPYFYLALLLFNKGTQC
jgi:hypothetical protein